MFAELQQNHHCTMATVVQIFPQHQPTGSRDLLSQDVSSAHSCSPCYKGSFGQKAAMLELAQWKMLLSIFWLLATSICTFKTLQ